MSRLYDEAADRRTSPWQWGRSQSVASISCRDLLTCAPATPVAEAARMMAERRCSSIVVAEGNRPVGIWTEFDALRLDLDDPEAVRQPVASVMSAPVRTIEGGRPLLDAAMILRDRNLRHLLVVDEAGGLTGIVTQTDIVRHQGLESYLTLRRVESVARAQPLFVDAGDSLAQVAAHMRQAASDTAFVTGSGDEIGIITERDIVRLIAAGQHDTAAGAAASRPVLRVRLDASLLEARRRLEDKGIRHLAVEAADGRILRVLSFGDIISAIDQGYIAELEESLSVKMAALADSENRLRILSRAVEQGSGMVIITDIDGRIEYVSPSFERVTGYRLAELQGQTPRILRCGDLSDEVYEEMWRTLCEGRTWQGELRNRRANGETFWVSASISPIRDAGGQVTHYVAVEEDISARKQAEQDLLVQKEWLSTLINAMTDFVCLKDGEGRWLVANDFGLRLFQLDPATYQGKTDEELWDLRPQYRAALAVCHASDEQAWQMRKLAHSQEFIPVPDDGVRIFDIIKVPLFHDDGSRRGLVVVGRDVTESRRAEDALRESEARYRTVFGAGAFGIVRSDISGRMIEVNNAFAQMLGYRPEELAGKPWRDVTHDEDLGLADEMLPELLAGRRDRFEVEKRYRTRDGATVWAHLVVTCVHDEEDRPDFLIGMVENITGRKQAEEALAEMTAELTRSNAELEQFSYSASHDLQEPLRMVSSYVQLLDRRYRGKLDAEADEFIHFAVDGAQRMQQMIKDLLDYSRIQRKGNPFAPTDLRQCFDIAMANLQIAVEESGAQVTAGALPVVPGDAGQLVRLLQNLIGNAIKYRRADVAPKVHISAVPQGRFWRITVEDNGIGIEEQYYDRVFQIFQRLHARDAYGGTGIGLAICKKIAERHGGHISLESEPGRGSRFHFTLRAV